MTFFQFSPTMPVYNSVGKVTDTSFAGKKALSTQSDALDLKKGNPKIFLGLIVPFTNYGGVTWLNNHVIDPFTLTHGDHGSTNLLNGLCPIYPTACTVSVLYFAPKQIYMIKP